MMQSRVKSQFNRSQWGFCFLHSKSSHASRETIQRMRQQFILVFFTVISGLGTPLPTFSLHPRSSLAAGGTSRSQTYGQTPKTGPRCGMLRPSKDFVYEADDCNARLAQTPVEFLPSEAAFPFLVTRRKITGEQGEEGP